MSEVIYYRNDTVGIKFTLRNKKTLQPLDLTDKTVTLTVDPNENPTSNAENLMQIVGVVQAPATDGVVIFTPVGAAADFAPGSYFYDIQMENTSDGLERQTVTKDVFTHRQDITK